MIDTWRVVATWPTDGVWADEWQVANYAGRDAYKSIFGPADTIAEAAKIRSGK